MSRRAALFTILRLMAFLIGGVLPMAAQEHIEVLPAGSLPRIADPAPALWAMSGYEIARVRVTVDGLTPIMRTELWDARLVEIVWRWQDVSHDWNRVEVIGDSVVIEMLGGDYRHYVVHGYLLMQVTQKWPQSAEAIHDLASNPNPLADTVLFHLLDFRSPQVREAALESLAERSEALGRIAARALLEDGNHLIRNAAAEVLGQVGTRQDVRRLRQALTDDHWVIRATVADSLGAVGGKAAHPALKNAMTTDPHPVVRRDAAFAFSYANQSAVVPDLEQALAREREEQAQIGLLKALYALGEQRYLTGLLELLRSEDCAVRHAVVNSLGEIVQPADKEQALQAIRDMLLIEDNPGVRIDAENTVEAIRSRSFGE